MAAPVTVSLPVFIRVGDGAEVQAGTITADSATGMQLGQVDLLRAVADEIQRLIADRPADEGQSG
ncbi:hypothetical protein [Streptomyces spectabilis]|nr:hypothetical protein [Streptomyces spectabilis]MBB5103294.1 hypothetical protein [Streptomyces spectabilis]MCI3902484.1 hypothetical protein [Streptomyces spectabilis]GGV13583.1 hypothetical protein GCM10010245_23700 [Streptomyces spectabilis]